MHVPTTVVRALPTAILTLLAALVAPHLALDAPAAARAQAPAASSLVLLVGPGDYPGETYTAGPVDPAEYVFFEGEAVRLDVRVANWGSRPADVLLPADPAQLASARLTDLGVRPAGDARPVMLAPSADPRPWKETSAEPTRLAWAPRLTLDPADALRWRLVLPAGALVPGAWRLDIELRVSDGAGQPPRRQKAALLFEVRSRASAEPAELARRTAEWLAADGAPDACAATEALARVYPDSVVVHLIRSRLADAAGDPAGARRELDEALVFMRADRDALFRRYARPGQIEDLIDSLLP